jgi:hypothetical protein
MLSLAATLRPGAIRNLGIGDIQEDFIFLVGEQRYTCPRIVARLLSQNTLVQHSIDPSINEYIVKTNDQQNEFPLLLTLGRSSLAEATSDNSRFLFSLSRELDNSALFTSCLHYFDVHQFFPIFDDDVLPVLASEFYKLNNSELDQIPLSTLYHILSHPSLKISHESTLYSYILSHLSSNPDYFELLQFVHFEYLSSEDICYFARILPERINVPVWEALSRRLRLPFDSCSVFTPSATSSKSVDHPRKTASVDGIISYLTKKHRGNVHDKGIVTITSKSISYGALGNVADLKQWSYFSLVNEPGQWICWDFHEMRVGPAHYVIHGVAVGNLKSWVVESSLDGENWIEIDR